MTKAQLLAVGSTAGFGAIGETMQTMFIIHEPGKVPRVGYPTGDEATSLREWQAHHPGAAIYVLQAADVPPPGTAAVQTAEEFLAIDDTMNDLDDYCHDCGEDTCVCAD